MASERPNFAEVLAEHRFMARNAAGRMGCRGCTWTTHLTPGTDRAWAAYADHLAAVLNAEMYGWLADIGIDFQMRDWPAALCRSRHPHRPDRRGGRAMNEHDAEWTRTQYVSEDGQALALRSPAGLIPPPVIDLHKPEIGAIRFFYRGEGGEE